MRHDIKKKKFNIFKENKIIKEMVHYIFRVKKWM